MRRAKSRRSTAPSPVCARIRKCESCQILARRRPQWNPIDATFHTVRENCNSPSKAPLAEDCCSCHSCRFMRQHLDFIHVFPAFLQDRREGLTATVTSSSPNAPEQRSESRSPLYQCDTHDRRGADQDIRGSIRSEAFSHKPKSRGTNYFKGLAASGLRDQKNLILRSVLPAGFDIPAPSSMTASN
jgi:hypothetical protein